MPLGRYSLTKPRVFSTLELFNTDPTVLSPQQIELLNLVCARLQTTITQMKATFDTEASLLNLFPPNIPGNQTTQTRVFCINGRG